MSHLENAPSRGQAGLRGQLIRDHERLDKLFEDLRAAFDADAREDAARLWTELDRGLHAHMDFEESRVLPVFHEVNAPEASRLLREHEAIRRSLTDLGIGVDLHSVRAERVADFIALLREHAQREDALLYRWAERELPESVRASFQPAPVGKAPPRPAANGRG